MEAGLSFVGDRQAVQAGILEVGNGIAADEDEMVMMAGVAVETRGRPEMIGAPICTSASSVRYTVVQEIFGTRAHLLADPAGGRMIVALQ